MHREDNSRFLLYIEPKKEDKSQQPINDEITEIMELALKEAESGTGSYSSLDTVEYFRSGDAYLGFHSTDCGEISANNDYLLKNGMITNSLCSFYLKYYRNVIPQTEINKVNKLVEFYKEK